MDLDLIIKNATIVTACEVLPAGLSIGIKNGKIFCIAQELSASSPHTQTIDAEGAYVTPGGVDSHVHLAQDNAPTSDGWLTGSRSALAGGNTTILAFASQERADTSLFPIVEKYHRRSRHQSYVDYGFHLILSNPTEDILERELPVMRHEGISSVKLYMTYVPLKLGDADLLNVMMRTRELGMTTMIHAENSDMIDMITKRLIARGHTSPEYHAVARPQISEAEATNRAISLANLTDTPLLIVHMSSPVAINTARKAQKRLLPIHTETCPHYLHLLSSKLAETTPHDHWEGAKHVCAPPLRHSEDDLEFIWDSINDGVITVISSDHAPSRYAHKDGKQKPLHPEAGGRESTTPTFSQIPNGLPGLETRLPLLFHAATSPRQAVRRRISLPKFVAITSTNPAKLYGLGQYKGSIAPGFDADLTIWYPGGDARGQTVITNKILHHEIDYTPFEGFEVANWPRWTLLRGEVKWDRDGGGIVGKPSDGRFLKRGAGQVLVGRTGQRVVGMKEGERDLWMT